MEESILDEFTLPCGEEMVTVSMLSNGTFDVAYPDGTTKLLCHSSDRHRKNNWYFMDDNDPVCANELGAEIEAYLETGGQEI